MSDDNNIWKFGDQYINIVTGEHGTPEEIAAFKERHRKLAEDGATRQKESELEDKILHERYDEKVRTYFEMEPDDETFVDIGDLVYQLSTRIFDICPVDYYKDKEGKYYDTHPIQNLADFNSYTQTQPEFLKDLNEIKELFPEIYEEAVLGFIEGNHDT